MISLLQIRISGAGLEENNNATTLPSSATLVVLHYKYPDENCEILKVFTLTGWKLFVMTCLLILDTLFIGLGLYVHPQWHLLLLTAYLFYYLYREAVNHISITGHENTIFSVHHLHIITLYEHRRQSKIYYTLRCTK